MAEEKPVPWWKQKPAASPSPAGGAATPSSSSSNASSTSASSGTAPLATGDLADGETREVRGSAATPYVMKNTGGVYSCSCPAWRNQSVAIEKRTCKHLRALRGDAAEDARAGASAPAQVRRVRAAGEDAQGPPLLLAHTWESDVDLTGWWMSEKLDGVRAYWDGAQLISRLGNAFLAPDWFKEALPDVPLDGELWGGRKKFQRTVSTVRRQDRSDAWKEIVYVVFDAPKLDAPFEERLAFVRERIEQHRPPYARPHPHELCRSLEHLREELARVEALGGEGLMMRRPGSRYEVGRSSTLLKVKTFKDAEARVVAHVPGAGRHKGRLGALMCQMPTGTQFSVGTGFSDAERDSPPPVGTIITYRYQELSNDGVPRFPSYLRVREDASPSPTPIPTPTPTPIPTPTPTPTPITGRSARIFVRDGRTWQIELRGSEHVVKEARGDAVATTTTRFPGPAAAWRDADARIAEKIESGFSEVDEG